MNETVQKRLAAITDLPTLPVVVAQLNKAVADPMMDAARIAILLQDDAAVSAKLLKVVNSALYSRREPISSIQMAVSRLGMTGVRNVATSVAIYSAFGAAPGGKTFDRDEFWRHCIFSGYAANVLHKRAKCADGAFIPSDLLHLAGLMHDIGRIVMDQFFHAEFTACLKRSEEAFEPLMEAERALIGGDHAEIGGWLAERWGVDHAIVQAIRWHHYPQSAEAEFRYLVSLCHVANYICNYQQIGWGGDMTPDFVSDVWDYLGITVSDAHEIGESIKEEAASSELLAAFG